MWIVDRHLQAEKVLGAGQTEAELKGRLALIEKLFLRYGVKESQIHTRFLECGDVLSKENSSAEIYKLEKEHTSGRDISERAQFFSRRAFEVLKKIYPESSVPRLPDHLLHVTCTGYVSPSAPQRLVTRRSWTHETGITHAYHMGCYAALPAVRLAEGLVSQAKVSNPGFKADIVHTEMCGLHMNPLSHTPEQMIVQTLFADGHIKYSVSSLKDHSRQNFRILAIHEKIVPNSEGDMSWAPTPWGMQMNLSREVPQKIKFQLKEFLMRLLQKANVSSERAFDGIFAVYPGGPKIIDSVQETLGLKEEQVAISKKILFERGNMSSATLPHVWQEILSSPIELGTLVTSFAFGPGLTIFGSVFELVD